MEFGVMFFSSAVEVARGEPHHLLPEAAKLADRNGFCSVLTHERHFHCFNVIVITVNVFLETFEVSDPS